jgi:hypothetical protein
MRHGQSTYPDMGITCLAARSSLAKVGIGLKELECGGVCRCWRRKGFRGRAGRWWMAEAQAMRDDVFQS